MTMTKAKMTGQPREVRATSSTLSNPKFQRLWSIYLKLSSDDQRKLERTMRFLANQSTQRLAVIVDNTR
jgi:hypothetical protein